MRWEGRPLLLCSPGAHPLDPAQRPEGCFLPPSTFFHPCDRMAANMICLHSCHVSGPFINCHTSAFTNRTAVTVSFYAGVTPPQKRVCLHLKSHVGDCCQFNMFNMETQSSLSSPVGNHIPFYISKLFQGYPSLFFYCCTE